MPIFTNNMIIKNSSNQEPKAPDERVVVNQQPDGKVIVKPEPIVEVEKVSVVPQTKHDKNKHVLVVDGKEKKISKQSAYLLDMLTLDEE